MQRSDINRRAMLVGALASTAIPFSRAMFVVAHN